MQDLEFLKKITDLPGGSGDEGRVRNLLKEEINKVTTAQCDGIGNVFGMVGKGPKVLAVGHMDEIGFMVRGISNDGKILVGKVGFVFPYGQECQLYTICTSRGDIDGVMGRDPEQAKGSHFDAILDVEQEMIDIGCTTKAEVEALGVEIGNAVIPKSHFTVFQNNQILGKAWDNRIGCAISVRAMQQVKKDLKVTYIGGGTVQEEVGCRGARALGVEMKADIAFSLDTAPAADEDGSRVGAGPQLFVMDSETIAHKKLLEFVKKVAKENNIPYQLCFLRHGGTDASEFQNIAGGTPCVAIGVAVKNIHTPVSVISYDDYENSVKLMKAILENLDEEKVKEIRSF